MNLWSVIDHELIQVETHDDAVLFLWKVHNKVRRMFHPVILWNVLPR